jgi:hypothetical protein
MQNQCKNVYGFLMGFSIQKVPGNQVYSGLCFSAGREGFEPSVEDLNPRQSLSRRSQSATLAPPQ